MRLEMTSGRKIKNPSFEDCVATLRGLHGESMMLIAADKPRAFLRIAGGPDSFRLRYHDGEVHKQFECSLPQNEDNTLRILKAYLRGHGDHKTLISWEDVTPDGTGDEWTDPMEGHVNRGGCTSVLIFAALVAGGALWFVLSMT